MILPGTFVFIVNKFNDVERGSKYANVLNSNKLYSVLPNQGVEIVE